MNNTMHDPEQFDQYWPCAACGELTDNGSYCQWCELQNQQEDFADGYTDQHGNEAQPPAELIVVSYEIVDLGTPRGKCQICDAPTLEIVCERCDQIIAGIVALYANDLDAVKIDWPSDSDGDFSRMFDCQ